MRSIIQSEYGDASAWALGELPEPRRGPNDLLIDVHAAAIDRGTWHLMIGEPLLMRPAFGFRGPRNPVPGRDFAGIVAHVGTKAEGFTVGDRVFGTASGTLREQVAARPSHVAHLPDSIEFATAAALPVSGMTAIQAVIDAGQASEGQRVLITGASGGVGHLAVQIARSAGATVNAVASHAKADQVRALGARQVFCYDLGEDPDRGYDLIVDIAGGRSLGDLRARLTPKGTLVMVGSQGGGGGKILSGFSRQLAAPLLSPFVRQHLKMLASRENSDGLDRLVALVESGSLAPHVHARFELADAADAMAELVSGSVFGKIVIDIA